jgi:hypothetical protein
MALFGFLNAGWFSHLFNPMTPPVSIPIDFSQANYVVEKNESPQIRGMINRVSHLVKVEEIEG